jgi:hypothetical protein
VCTFLLSRNKILEEPAYSQLPEGTLGIEIGPRVMIIDRGQSNGVKQLQTFIGFVIYRNWSNQHM